MVLVNYIEIAVSFLSLILSLIFYIKFSKHTRTFYTSVFNSKMGRIGILYLISTFGIYLFVRFFEVQGIEIYDEIFKFIIFSIWITVISYFLYKGKV